MEKIHTICFKKLSNEIYSVPKMQRCILNSVTMIIEKEESKKKMVLFFKIELKIIN